MSQRFSITPSIAALDPLLTDSEHRTLAVIGTYGDREGWCWPSQSVLAEQRNVSRKTINVHIRRLIDLGYLNIQPRYDEETGAQKSNMMQIRFDFPPDVTPPVTSMTLQGVSPLGGYRGCNPLDVTHNDPMNDPEERIYKAPGVTDVETDRVATDDVINSLVTAISAVCKDVWSFVKKERFDDTALHLFTQNASPADLPLFLAWWETNGWHDGKPWLTDILNHWDDFTEGKNLKRQTNGNGRVEKQVASTGLKPVKPGVY